MAGLEGKEASSLSLVTWGQISMQHTVQSKSQEVSEPLSNGASNILCLVLWNVQGA